MCPPDAVHPCSNFLRRFTTITRLIEYSVLLLTLKKNIPHMMEALGPPQPPSQIIQLVRSDSSVTWDYQSSYLNAFAGKFSSSTLSALTSNSDVESITEDAIFTTQCENHTDSIVQSDAPWGLARISQKLKLDSNDTSALTYNYTYDAKAGQGVDVYVLDTGINIEHVTFEGRATWGFSAVGGTTDGHGHGTHCAGTIAGFQYGVAKKANVIAVKVLSDGGSGSVSGIVAGIDWVIKKYNETGRPSIISMSLGGGANDALDAGVTAAVDAGVHVVVAAGNSNADAKSFSPARAPSVITVGATTIADARASFSNYGALVDVWAPGQYVISAWKGSPNATNNISGTSMATPHVAGLAAYLLSIHGTMPPADLTTRIKSIALTDVITGIPEGTPNTFIQTA
ncbi:subtilisin-like serine protease [Tulasnella sp. 418]|nr:subtilisin-like serine protease [Tulasnella sp. 418]